MKTLKNGFAEIWEVADALAAAAFGMDMKQAKEEDALRRQNLSADDKFGEGLVSGYTARYGSKPLLAPTKAELLARAGQGLRLALVHIAESPALNAVAKAGGKPTPCGLTTKISLSYLRELYSGTAGENHVEYVKALDAWAPVAELHINETRSLAARGNRSGHVNEAGRAEDRQQRRYQMCVDAGLVMPTNDYAPMPRGIGSVAAREGITRQAFVQDVKAHINRVSGR